MLYFDHAATTSIYPEVLASLHKSLGEDFANPSSSHALGRKLRELIDEARSFFLKTLGAHPDDHFIFTSSATESNNTIIKGLNLKAGDVVLYSKADHPSVVAPIENLKEKGVELVPLKLLKNGTIDFFSLPEKKIALAVFSQVNHQSGNIYDIKKLSELVKKNNPHAHVHVDAVQAFGKTDVKLTKDIDSMSVTAHKIGGPKSIAGLYLKKNHKIKPLLVGGDQQYGMRAGTESYPLVKAFAHASKISLQKKESNFEKISKLKTMVEDSIAKNIPSAQFIFEETSPYILSFILPGISSDIILRHLEAKNIFVGSTSACSSRIKAYNPTLDAFLIPEKFHKNILRISFGDSSNEADTEQFISEFLISWSELRPFIK